MKKNEAKGRKKQKSQNKIYLIKYEIERSGFTTLRTIIDNASRNMSENNQNQEFSVFYNNYTQ